MGCAPKEPKPLHDEIEALAKSVMSISPDADKKEAYLLSKEAILHSRELAIKYSANTAPWFHNFLVNVGARDRGLCYEWATDLRAHLQNFGFKTFKFRSVVANRREYFEHNAIVVTTDENPLESAVLLDAWRNSGVLYWSSIKEDTKYRWEIR